MYAANNIIAVNIRSCVTLEAVPLAKAEGIRCLSYQMGGQLVKSVLLLVKAANRG